MKQRSALAAAIGALIVVAWTSGASPNHRASDGFPAAGELLFLDLGAGNRTGALWGSVDCAQPRRVSVVHRGGVPHTRPRGGRADNESYRRLRVREGDNVSDGQRCEIGLNDHRDGPTALYREGQRRVTFLSYRLPKGFPLGRPKWQVAMQMKQSQPADAGGGRPILALHVADHRWRLIHAVGTSAETIWSRPARGRQWTRFAFDIVYSKDPAVGSMQIYVDLDGDGDARGPRERSRPFGLQTLKAEDVGPGDDGLALGDPIPSHLRVGLYQDPEYGCARANCSIHVDNAAVYAP